mmetsp:Transcript_31542/g.89549  ORF Transcript_31542/g.89549 Transcript_31542/m.89549 type:complete len:220 (+) Transcript_31542:170-829(+)
MSSKLSTGVIWPTGRRKPSLASCERAVDRLRALKRGCSSRTSLSTSSISVLLAITRLRSPYAAKRALTLERWVKWTSAIARFSAFRSGSPPPLLLLGLPVVVTVVLVEEEEEEEQESESRPTARPHLSSSMRACRRALSPAGGRPGGYRCGERRLLCAARAAALSTTACTPQPSSSSSPTTSTNCISPSHFISQGSQWPLKLSMIATILSFSPPRSILM